MPYLLVQIAHYIDTRLELGTEEISYLSTSFSSDHEDMLLSIELD
jgi:hypothetical protein